MPKGGMTNWNEKGAKEALSAQEKLLSKKQEQQSIDSSLASSLSDMVKHGVKINKNQTKWLKTYEATEKVADKVEDIEENINKQLRQSNEAKKAAGVLNKNMLKTLQDQAKNGEISKKQAEEYSGIIQDLSGEIQSVADIQKVIDDLGDDINEDMREYLEGQKEIARIQQSQKGLMEAGDELTGGMASKAAEFVNIMKANPMVATLMVATKILTQFSENLDKIGDEFGAMGIQEFADDLMAADTQLKKLGYDSGTAAEITSELTENFGMGMQEAMGLSVQVGQLSKGLGLSVQEGSKLFGTFTQLGGMSEQQALDLAAQANNFATMNNVNPKAVMADIADSTEAFAKFGGKGGDEFVKAAVMAKKLGTNLDQVSNTMESMLDFQDSTTKAMEASIMIGREINIQKLQEASLAGEATTVLEEQKRLLGDQASFNNLNWMEQRKLAEAIGLTHEEAIKMVNKQEEAVDLAGELADQEGFDDLVTKDTQSSLTELINTLTSLGATFTNVLGPPLNFVVGVIGEFVGFIAPLVEGLTSMIGPLGTAGLALALFGKRALVSAVMGVWSGLKWLWAIPVVGPGLAIAAGVMGVAAIYKQLAKSKSTKVEDAGIPAGDGPVVTTPEGKMFEGVANDDVLMAPGIAGAAAATATAGGGANGAMVEAINNLNKTTQENKPPTARQIGKKTSKGIEQIGG